MMKKVVLMKTTINLVKDRIEYLNTKRNRLNYIINNIPIETTNKTFFELHRYEIDIIGMVNAELYWLENELMPILSNIAEIRWKKLEEEYEE